MYKMMDMRCYGVTLPAVFSLRFNWLTLAWLIPSTSASSFWLA